MRIVIDMQGAQTESRFRGIGRYTMSLTQAIVRNRGEHEIILALSGLFPDTIEPIRAAFNGLLPQENIRVWYAPGPVRERDPGNEWRREVAECIREAFLASLRPDAVFISSLFEGYCDDAVTSIGVFAPHIPTAVVLYDLIPLLNPEIYLHSNPAYAKNYQRKIEHLKQAKRWLAISESAAGEGRAALALPTDAVVNISTACDSVFRPITVSEDEREQFFKRFGCVQPFILYSGGADGRKNLRRLIRAYAGLPKPLHDIHQLVLAGRMPEGEVAELKRTAKSVGIRDDQLIFTGYIDDEELARFYNLCTVFVFPSLHEGFGLPALEAMACGAAVIGSNTTSVPEVIGCQDAMFDPCDEGAISRKLVQALSDSAFRAELTAHGLEQAKKFSWDESAKRAIAAFENLHPANGGCKQNRGARDLLPQLIQKIATLVPLDLSDMQTNIIAQMLSCIHADTVSKQLFVDISELAQRDAKTGVQRVTRSILKELLKSPPEGYVVEPVYATTDTPGYRYARRFSARFLGGQCDLEDDPIDYCSGDIFLGLDLQHHVVGVQEKYLATLRQDGVKVFFVIYDLLPILMPRAFPPGTDLGHVAWLKILVKFDGVVCISRAVATELEEWQRQLGPQRLRPFKIGWFHLGADVENSVPTLGLPDDAGHVLEELTHRPTFVTVGTIEPRKGQTQALAAFELLWKQGIDANLIIVGKQGWMVEPLIEKLRSHIELNKRLFWMEGISDEYLEKVYAASTCLLAASEGEGFGLPLIEAALHKVPIIARDIPVFREVAGDHAFYFKGLEPQNLSAAIKNWLMLNVKGKAPQSINMPWLTWSQSAQQLLQVILSEGSRHAAQSIPSAQKATANDAASKKQSHVAGEAQQNHLRANPDRGVREGKKKSRLV